MNRVEIRGAAFGTLSHGTDAGHATDVLVRRPRGVVRSVDDIAAQRGGVLRFSNVEQETPIQKSGPTT